MSADASTRSSAENPRGELLLLAALAVLAAAHLDLAPVVTMEGIVAGGARRMLREGDWAVTYLYGELYTFKPPLAYWLTAGSFRLLGETALALRLPFAVAGILGPWLGARALARVVGFERAAWCALAGASGSLMLQKVRIAEFDGLLAAGLGVAILAASVNLARERAHPGLWLLAGAGLTFGFLAKGAPAVGFFAPGLVAAAVATRRARRLVSPAALLAWSGALAAIGAWAWCAWQQAGAAAFAQPLAEGTDRATAWSLERLGAALLAPLALLGVFAPWSLVLPWVRPEGTDGERALRRALLAFVLSGLVVFMLVPRTSLRYLLPLAAPVGALAALHLTLPGAQRPRRPWWGLLPLVCGGVALATALGAFGTSLPWHARVLALALATPAVLLGAQAWRARRLLPRGSLSVSAFAACALALFVGIAFGTDLRRAERRAMEATAAELDPLLGPDETLWVDWFDTHSNLHFLLDRPWERFSLAGELPAPGSLLLLRASQSEALTPQQAARVERLHETSQGRTRFVLARVRE